MGDKSPSPEGSLRARMLLAYVGAIRRGDQREHLHSWEHCVRVLAANLIGEGA
jgi:hypothetical protein